MLPAVRWPCGGRAGARNVAQALAAAGQLLPQLRVGTHGADGLLLPLHGLGPAAGVGLGALGQPEVA